MEIENFEKCIVRYDGGVTPGIILENEDFYNNKVLLFGNFYIYQGSVNSRIPYNIYDEVISFLQCKRIHVYNKSEFALYRNKVLDNLSIDEFLSLEKNLKKIPVRFKFNSLNSNNSGDKHYVRIANRNNNLIKKYFK